MRRQLTGTLGAVLILALVGFLAYVGEVSLPDYWTQLAVGFTLLAVALLGWAWKPNLSFFFAVRNQPKLVVEPTQLKKGGKELKEFRITFPDGQERRTDARFYFITLKNIGRRTAENVVVYCDSDEMLYVPWPSRKKESFSILGVRPVRYDSSEDFDRAFNGKDHREAFVYALLDSANRNPLTIHPGEIGETFALFFTLKDFPQLCIPAFTRVYERFPCSTTMRVYVGGKDFVKPYTTSFEVNVANWDSIKVKQIEPTHLTDED